MRTDKHDIFKWIYKMRNIVSYTDNLKKKKWGDFHFDLIEINTLPIFKNLSSFEAMDIFNEAIFKEIHNLTAKNTLKLLLTTPDMKSKKVYGIAFLNSKEILTIEIKRTPLFEEWFSLISNDTSQPEIYSCTNNSSSCRPIFSSEQDLTHRGTGKFICSEVPNSFIARELTKEKSDFLAPFIQLNANDNFDLIEKNFKALVKQNNLTVCEPKNNNAIYAEFEKEAGFAFPAILKSFLTLHDGVENTAFMSAQSIIKEWRNWQYVYDEWTQEELFDADNENNTITLPMYVTPYWMPFFNLRNGNFIALDFVPNTEGTSGQVISFGADEQSAIYEAKALSEFLQGFIKADT